MIDTIELHDEFTKNRYLITIHLGGAYSVDADCEQDALDTVIDYWCKDKHKFRGYFLSDEEVEEEEYLEEYLMGGNEGVYTNFHDYELRITEVTRSNV